MRKYKCRICKQLVEPNDLYEYVHITKSKKQLMYRFHHECFEKKEKEREQKQIFFDYIKENFFNIVIPNRLFVGLADIKSDICSYKDILSCCNRIGLINIVNKIEFINDNAKASYIVAVIKGSINKYMENKYNEIEKENNMMSCIDDDFIKRENDINLEDISFDF